MRMAPYRRRYQRTPAENMDPAGHLIQNSACRLTDQGADPDPGDLGWCIRREWRVIYYSARSAAGLPLWEGVDEFELLMIDVLLRLSSGYEPIAPLGCRAGAGPADRPSDRRGDRVHQPSCRIFRTPVFRQRRHAD